MRVIGIDPGTYKMGVGVVYSNNGELTLAHSEVITPKRRAPIHQRLQFLFKELMRIIGELAPTELAIEEVFAGENKRTAMAIGHAQAAAMIAAASHGLDVCGYAPTQIKQSVTDYGGSSKEQVQQMVQVLLDLSHAPESLDVSDAIAVAICHINASHVAHLNIMDN